MTGRQVPSDNDLSKAADPHDCPNTGQKSFLESIIETKSPTETTTLHDSAYSPTSGKVQSPDSEGTVHDLPTSPQTTSSLSKPHFEAVATNDSTDNHTPSSPPRLFRSVEAELEAVGAFRILAVRRTWSYVANRLSGDTDAPSEPTWRTTSLRFGPLSGLFAMIAAVGTMIASLGVLVGSNGQAVASWSAPPSTYLAIFTAIANLGMRYACVQGAVIAWWVRAMRGSTFSKLHHDWRSGTTLRGALTAGRHTGLLGLACIFSTLVVIDGPLLQRSSRVITGPVAAKSIPLKCSMAQELPTGHSGVWTDAGSIRAMHYNVATFNSTMPSGSGSDVSNSIHASINIALEASVSSSWYSDEPLHGIVSGCAGKCKATLRAPALAQAACITSEMPTRYMDEGDLTALTSTEFAPPLDGAAFFIATTLVTTREQEGVTLVTGHATTTDCVGNLTITACDYVSAIGDYSELKGGLFSVSAAPLADVMCFRGIDVTIEGDAVTLINPGDPTIVALANNTAVDRSPDSNNWHESTLGGIVYLHFVKWTSDLHLAMVNGSIQTASVGRLAQGQSTDNMDATCPSFRDPHEDMVAELNKLIVQAGLEASRQDPEYLTSRMDPGVEFKTTTTGYLTGTESVYHTDFAFFAAAMVVELVCVALVAPTYWNWWTLGRSVSFSPLEIAKAFQSPLLAECHSNSSGRDMAGRLKDIKIQYGVVDHDDSEKDEVGLAFADPEVAVKPRTGTLINT